MSFGWGGLVEGIIGGIHNRNDELSGREEQRKDRELQEQSMQHGISWRVKDAQEAGIHPLFALGANLPVSSPTIRSGSDTSWASGFGRAAQSVADREQVARDEERRQERHDAEIGVLNSEAKRNDAVAQQATASVMARAAQNANIHQDGEAIIYPKGQVNPPSAQVERFRSPMGELDAQKIYADAEEYERRYGDVAQEVFGLSNLISDLWKKVTNIDMKEIRRQSDKWGKEIQRRYGR